jgi:2-methylcitrate dehydratase PrpD
MDTELPHIAVAEHLASKIAALDAARLPASLRSKCEDLLIDVIGLCATARREPYVTSAIAGWDDEGSCTAIGHARPMSAAGAAFVNGTAAHGEDFDDTFEGGPVHAGAVVVPAVLAACERYRLPGQAALLGIAVGVETVCRLGLVAPKAVHKAGFHPTAIFGAMAAASSNIWPRAPGPSGCIRAGPRNRASGRRCSDARDSSAHAPCSRACMGSFTVLPTPPRAITTR